MCGIAGRFNLNGHPVDFSHLNPMISHLKHRGPDGSGHYVKGAIGLAQTRLAVIDVPGGAQPMFNEDKSIVVVFNGEIYNFQSIRSKLEKHHHFSTKSDTEVILHLYEDEGIDCFKQFRGMFAIALWDQRKKKLILARDRLGQKPLFYYLSSDCLIFSSEIRALLATGLQSKLNLNALNLYFKNQFISGPETIYQSIQSFPPAHVMTIDQKGSRMKAYWSPSVSIDKGMRERDYAEALRTTLSEAVKLRLKSDVPLGAFLSGGFDSSLIVGLMKEAGVSQVNSFSIGFKEKTFDETHFAKEASDFFQCEHQSGQLKENIAERLPHIVKHFDQPFGDSSSIALFQLSEMTRKSVTVALSGDGCDELFAGYRRYVGRRLLKYYWGIPKAVRLNMIERMIGFFPEGTSYYRSSFIKQFKLFAELSNRLEANPLDLLPSTFTQRELDRLYSPHVVEELAKSKKEAGKFWPDSFSNLDEVSQMMWFDLHSYLPDDILVKVDRMSMAHGLEVRTPFLDQEVVDLALKMPIDFKLKSLQTKYILKKTFSSVVPERILNRKKHGFMLPLGLWFKKELKPFIEDFLLKADQGRLFNMDYIAEILREHQEGYRDHSQKIWLLLVYRLWEESV